MKAFVNKVVHEANFLSLAANVAIAFFGFTGFALIARTYPLEMFGRWVLYISSAVFLEMFRFGITHTAIIRYLSGVDPNDRIKYIGSNGLIGLITTIGISVILWTCHLLFPGPIHHAGYDLFFKWYPILAFINLPLNTALVVMQADQRFDKLLMIKAINNGGFFLIILVNYLFFTMTLTHLVWLQIANESIASLICIANGWDGLRYIRKATQKTNKVLLDFGKFTTFTLVGSNLLRSADTLIISLSPLGTAAVALYSIPMKLLEIQQIPLRSFMETAFPKMSKDCIQGLKTEVKKTFYTYSGTITYLFILISLITYIFAEYFVLLVGGKQYLIADPTTGSSAVMIVRIFSIYALLLPIDKMTGVGLDSINRPGKNFKKVFYMVVANVIGDLIAVFIFKSLEMVAVASILFTLVGITVGYYFLDKQLNLEFSKIFAYGFQFYKVRIKKHLVEQFHHNK